MIQQGEGFDAGKIWPAPSAGSVEFSNQLARLLQSLPPELNSYAGMVSAIILDEAYQARRGSQEPRSPPSARAGPGKGWDHFDTAVRQARPALRTLQQLMKAPPPDMGYHFVERLENPLFPDYVNVRRAAQVLQAAAINDLHQGDLAEALEDLEALLAFGRLYAQEPSLAGYMFRVATTGLSVDVCWDALQAPGWTEPQLARLQQACEAKVLLSQMPRTLEAERANRLYDLNWFRSHTYEEWIARCQPIYQNYGVKLPTRHSTPPIRIWRQWVFHPVWRLAWADQEELNYLRQFQPDLTAWRQATNQPGWLQLKQQIAAHYENYRPPTAGWRFYVKLPLVDDVAELFCGKPGTPGPAYPCPDYSKAWQAAFRNLSLHEMVITAVAIKRHELRHGTMPTDLASLVPTFLASVPRDLMDGKPLRYRLNADGSFTLYSIGEDTQDDGGDRLPGTPTQGQQQHLPWSGRDWVWPQVR